MKSLLQRLEEAYSTNPDPESIVRFVGNPLWKPIKVRDITQEIYDAVDPNYPVIFLSHSIGGRVWASSGVRLWSHYPTLGELKSEYRCERWGVVGYEFKHLYDPRTHKWD